MTSYCSFEYQDNYCFIVGISRYLQLRQSRGHIRRYNHELFFCAWADLITLQTTISFIYHSPSDCGKDDSRLKVSGIIINCTKQIMRRILKEATNNRLWSDRHDASSLSFSKSDNDLLICIASYSKKPCGFQCIGGEIAFKWRRSTKIFWRTFNERKHATLSRLWSSSSYSIKQTYIHFCWLCRIPAQASRLSAYFNYKQRKI